MIEKILLLSHLSPILEKVKAYITSVLPKNATKTAAGIVKIGDGLNVVDGTISVDSDAVVSDALPTASKTLKGAVKVGANINVSPDGTISVEAPKTKLSEFTNDSGFQNLSQVEATATAKAKEEVGKIMGEDVPETFDTLKEIATYIEEHQTTVDAINAAIGNKADKTSVYSKEEAEAKFVTADSIVYASADEVNAELTKVFGA